MVQAVTPVLCCHENVIRLSLRAVHDALDELSDICRSFESSLAAWLNSGGLFD